MAEGTTAEDALRHEIVGPWPARTLHEGAHGPDLLRRAEIMAAGTLELQWQPDFGYCSPNVARYRWQWLWDSCFNAIIFGALGDERGVTELSSLMALQNEEGFVPHMGYQAHPETALPLWGRSGASSVTQPPMYGHAAVELDRMGFSVDALIEPVIAGLLFFATHRRGTNGLVRIVHPWESGADNTPRWDRFCPGGFDKERWLEHKKDLVRSVECTAAGSSIKNPAFDVYPAQFNALVAFNAKVVAVHFGVPELARFAEEITEALDQTWRDDLETWVDVDESGQPLGTEPTIDALLGVLVDHTPERVAAVSSQLWSDAAFGAPFGPCSVSRSSARFDSTGYWRGPGWPHLNYLHWVAMDQLGRRDDADRLASQLLAASVASSFGEYVEPFTGEPLGAQPQTWAGLCIVPSHRAVRSEQPSDG